MKLIVSTFVLGLAMIVSVPVAEARVCAAGAHGAHCISHKRIAHRYHHHYYHHHYYHHHHYYYGDRYSEYGAPVGPPPPPYAYYYPPVPASIFDIPPEDRLPANTLQWLMNAENDPPFAEGPRYGYYR